MGTEIFVESSILVSNLLVAVTSTLHMESGASVALVCF